MQYIDDEGDKVLLSGDGDLSSAVNVARTAGLKVRWRDCVCMPVLARHLYSSTRKVLGI